MPNTRVHNLACLLRVGLDKITWSSSYSNYELESQMVEPFDLTTLLHCRVQCLPLNMKNNLLIQDTCGLEENKEKNGAFRLSPPQLSYPQASYVSAGAATHGLYFLGYPRSDTLCPPFDPSSGKALPFPKLMS